MTINPTLTLKASTSAKITAVDAFYIGTLILLFRPANYVIGDMIYQLLSYCLALCAALLVGYTVVSALKRFLFQNPKMYAPSLPVFLLALLFLWCMFGSTLINMLKGNPVYFGPGILFASTGVGMILLTDIGLTKRPQKYMRHFMLIGSGMCMINNLTIFLLKSSGGFRGGDVSSRGYGFADMSNFYFFAEDNASLFWTWPVLIAVWCYYLMYDKSRRMKNWAVIFTVSTLLAFLYAWSLTAMFCFVATVGLLIISFRSIKKKKKHSKLVDIVSEFNILTAAAVFFNFLIAVVQITSRFSYLIEKYLHKSGDLSGRITIWKRAIKYIHESPLIGFGNEAKEFSELKLGINHTHNFLLENMYRGGVIALIILFLTLLTLGIRGKKVEKHPLYLFLIRTTAMFIAFCSIEFAFYRYAFVFVFVLISHKELFSGMNEINNQLIGRLKQK